MVMCWKEGQRAFSFHGPIMVTMVSNELGRMYIQTPEDLQTSNNLPNAMNRHAK